MLHNLYVWAPKELLFEKLHISSGSIVPLELELGDTFHKAREKEE